MEKQIKAWLESKERNYRKGVDLLRKICKNRNLIAYMDRRKDMSRLVYNLEKHLRVSVPAPEKAPDKPKETKTGQLEGKDPKGNIFYTWENGRPVKENLPKELQELWNRNTELYRLSRGLHAKLKEMAGRAPHEREQYTRELARVGDEIRENWRIIDYFNPDDSKGEEPVNKNPDPEPNPDPPVVDHKRINANRTYISKNKKKLAELPEDETQKRSEIIVKIQGRMDELNGVGETFSEELINELKDLGLDVEKCKTSA